MTPDRAQTDPPMSQMRGIEVYTTCEQLTDLAPFWDGLGTFLNAPFGKFRWILTCAETLAADSQLFVPVIRDGRTPVAIAPLVRPHGFLAVARQLGVEEHGEPGDFNYNDTESLDLLARVLAENHVPLVLARTPVDSPMLAALRRAYRRRGFVVLRPQPSCPFIEIEATEDRTSARLPARLRSDLRRALRRAEQLGVVSFETHAPATDSDLLPLWEESLKVEAAGWKGRSQTALQSSHRLGSFYRSYAGRACEQGILRILFLKLGPDIASMMIALEASDRFWILKIGFDERFAKCSPGMLLMHEALRYAARRGLKSYEFLGSATDWTRRWTGRERPIHRVLIYPYTVQGAAILVSHMAEFLGRRVCFRLRGGRC
jgi:CelD/BcsL family acetyltransferase involved in cellulose biosynthesis